MSSIDAVLQDIHSLTKLFCYLVIDLQPLQKTKGWQECSYIVLLQKWWEYKSLATV